MNWDENPANGKNPDGLHFQFFKIDESSSSGKSIVTYRVYVPGVPVSKKYALTAWRIGSEPRPVPGDVYVNGKGLLMVHKPKPGQEDSDFVEDDELHLNVQAARGEPVRYALTSSDKQIVIDGTVVPFPLEANGNGCRLEVRLGAPDADGVLISADGLPANADVPFQLVSGGVADAASFHADAQGHAVTMGLPFVGGDDLGFLRVTLVTQGCSAAVEVPWGKKS
ncbi:MAG: hypothetical protein ABSD72_04045 [Terracidiphilus sp.]|jgi:hypothetical protein